MNFLTDSKEKKRVIIWGAGVYGQLIFENLSEEWVFCVEICGVADANPTLNERLKLGEKIFKNETMNHKVTHIFNLDEVKELYCGKCIDGVVIGVSECYYDEVKNMLDVNGITVLNYPEPREVSVKQIQEKEIYIGEEEIVVHVLKNVNVVTDNVIKATWIFTEHGEKVKEIFNYEHNYNRFNPHVMQSNGRNHVRLSDEVCVLSKLWSDNYWHFLYEVVDKVLLAKKAGFNGRYMLWDMPYIRQLMKILHVTDDEIIWVDVDKCYRFKCDCVWNFEAVNGLDGKTTKYICEWADSVVKENIDEEKKNYPKRVYVKRIGTRKLKGVEEILKKYGFTTIVPEDFSVLEQIKVFHNAEIVFCPHGANSSNVLFMKKGTTFIETFGYSYINPCCMHVINRKRVKYHMIVEPLDGITENKHYSSDYELPAVLLESVLNGCIDNERC